MKVYMSIWNGCLINLWVPYQICFEESNVKLERGKILKQSYKLEFE